MVLVFLGLGLSYYFYQNYQDDRRLTRDIPTGMLNLRTRTTKLAVDQANMILVQYLVRNISNCKRFPENLKEIFEPLRPVRPKGCSPLKTPDAWVNPWGHPYEIRYDRERKMLQIRSLGRYWWWPWDNIQDETNMAIPKIMADEERAKCDRGDECVFDRGWH